MQTFFLKFTLLSVLFLFSSQIVFSQEVILSPAQMQKDLEYTKAVLENIHPGTYRYNTPEQIDKYFEELGERCSQPMGEKTFFLILSQFTAKLKCGHTFLSPYNMGKKISSRIFSKNYFPIYFKVIDDKIIVTHNLSEDSNIKSGDEIVSINGIHSKIIVDSLLTVSRTDGQNGKAKMYDNLNLTPSSANGKGVFDIFFPLFFPDGNEKYMLRVHSSEGKFFNAEIKSDSLEGRKEKFKNLYGEIPEFENSWEFRFIDNKTAYFKIGTFAFFGRAFDSTYKNYVDSVFNKIRNKNISNLVIDIRGNVGGSDAIRNYILSYIMLEPFGCDNPVRRFYRYISIADSLKPYLDTWDESFKEPKSPDVYKINNLGFYEESIDMKPCTPKKIAAGNFTGKIYLLTDAANSSSSFLMADILKKYNRAVLIGETTGGNMQGINGAQFFFFRLPESKLEIDIPLVFQYAGENKKDGGIEPNFLVETNGNDIAKGIDTQLDYVMKLIK